MLNDVILVNELLGMTTNVRNASLFRARKRKISLKYFFLFHVGSNVPVV